MNVKLNGHKKKDPTAGLDDGDTIAKLMRPFYAQLAELAFDDANDIDGIDISFSLDNPFVQTVLDKLARQVRGVASTTQDDIRRLTGQAAAEGWGAEQLAREIRKTGADLSRSRSVAIARSESAAGFSQGSVAAWKTSGVVDRKQWLQGPDSCEICQALDGMTVGIDEDFADGISAPPAHTNCTCVIQPVLSE